MPYEILEKEIKTLSKADIAQVYSFIMRLKATDESENLRNKSDYETTTEK